MSGARVVPPRPRPRRLLQRLWSDRSLGGRLMLVNGLVLAIAMAAVLLVVTTLFARQSVGLIDSGLSDDIHEFKTAALARPASQTLDAFAADYLARQPFELGTAMVVKVAGGTVRGSPGSAALRSDPQVAAWLASPPAVGTPMDLTLGSASYRVRVSPLAPGAGGTGAVISATDLAAVRNEGSQVLLLTAAEAGFAVLLSLLTTWLVLRAVLGVVGEVTRTASSITSASPGQRLEERRANDEIGRLVGTFNAMLARLEAASQVQRQLLSDVSHQLRTPLTVMRGHLEVARRTGLEDPAEARETIDLVLDELAHASVLVDRVLELGRSLEPDFIRPEPVDLRSLLADVLAAGRALAPRRWSLGPVPDLVVLVDREKTRGALLNLVDNSVKATGADDAITVSAEEGPGAAVSLVVRDTGVGIPAELHDRIMRRFDRGSRMDDGGSGLGLAIVTTVAEAHGGHVTIESAAGAGCTVRIVLPPSRVERTTPPKDTAIEGPEVLR